jgi:2,4-dienoyl-CoA reductase-like NADH-dependent reductase (Old Yellow Enzyme family)
MTNIFQPYTFRRSGFTAKNRITLAPMTNGQSHEDGTLGDDEYRWLMRRAKEDFGVIITCAAHVSPDGQGWAGELGIWDDKHISGLKRLADGLHEYGSLALVQIFHGGARSPEHLTGTQPWSASEHIYSVGTKNIEVREATEQDILRVTNDFIRAAVRAKEAGMDGVELHGAHGYLIHQFLSTATNTRTDRYGGSAENRSRFLVDILAGIRKQVGDNFIVGVRISPEDKYTFKGIDFDESVDLAVKLARLGADYIHVSPWNALKKPDKYSSGDKALITWFREVLPEDIPVMVAGEIWSVEDADQAMDFGADFIALGRAGIGIPDWPARACKPKFIPLLPPYTPDYLRTCDLSDSFINYMRRWQGFVV